MSTFYKLFSDIQSPPPTKVRSSVKLLFMIYSIVLCGPSDDSPILFEEISTQPTVFFATPWLDIVIWFQCPHKGPFQQPTLRNTWLSWRFSSSNLVILIPLYFGYLYLWLILVFKFTLKHSIFRIFNSNTIHFGGKNVLPALIYSLPSIPYLIFDFLISLDPYSLHFSHNVESFSTQPTSCSRPVNPVTVSIFCMYPTYKQGWY